MLDQVVKKKDELEIQIPCSGTIYITWKFCLFWRRLLSPAVSGLRLLKNRLRISSCDWLNYNVSWTPSLTEVVDWERMGYSTICTRSDLHTSIEKASPPLSERFNTDLPKEMTTPSSEGGNHGDSPQDLTLPPLFAHRPTTRLKFQQAPNNKVLCVTHGVVYYNTK